MSKQEMRKELAALSFTEKVKILEKLRDRSEVLAASGLRGKVGNPHRQQMSLGEEHVVPLLEDSRAMAPTDPTEARRTEFLRQGTGGTLQINDDFIREWEAKYDNIEPDEGEYQRLVAVVAREVNLRGTISQGTFVAIWKWKKAIRRLDLVRMDEYETLYANAFRRAAQEPPHRRLAVLIGPNTKLPGVGAPTGSTVLHFMDPGMPIIDVRTVEVLFTAGLISTKSRDLNHYEEYRHAISEIERRCPRWSIRQIDRALFAYHKIVMQKKQNKECPVSY